MKFSLASGVIGFPGEWRTGDAIRDGFWHRTEGLAANEGKDESEAQDRQFSTRLGSCNQTRTYLVMVRRKVGHFAKTIDDDGCMRCNCMHSITSFCVCFSATPQLSRCPPAQPRRFRGIGQDNTSNQSRTLTAVARTSALRPVRPTQVPTLLYNCPSSFPPRCFSLQQSFISSKMLAREMGTGHGHH